MLHCKQTKGHADKCFFQRLLGLRNVLIWEVSLRRRNWKNFGAMRHVDFHFQPLIKLRQIRSMWDVTSPTLLGVVALSFCLTTLPSRISPCSELSPRHLYLITETKHLINITSTGGFLRGLTVPCSAYWHLK